MRCMFRKLNHTFRVHKTHGHPNINSILDTPWDGVFLLWENHYPRQDFPKTMFQCLLCRSIRHSSTVECQVACLGRRSAWQPGIVMIIRADDQARLFLCSLTSYSTWFDSGPREIPKCPKFLWQSVLLQSNRLLRSRSPFCNSPHLFCYFLANEHWMEIGRPPWTCAL